MDLSDKTIAITGIGGFIGLRMAERAMERGMSVKGLDLSPEAARRARALGADVIVGSVNDKKRVAQMCADADVVFHTAAVVEEGGSMELFRKVNVEGTRTVAAAALEADAMRFVHLSSVMVYGFKFPPYVTEEGPLRGENNPYCQTKIESEAAAMECHKPGHMEVIIIRPGDVYGPGSVPWVLRPLQMIKAGQFALFDGGRGTMNHLYVDNLLDGIFLALEKDATGEPFNLTDGCDTSWAEYFGYLSRMAGHKKLRSIPSKIARPAFEMVEKVFGALGKKAPGSAEAIKFLQRPYPYSIARARKVLGYEPQVSLKEGMQRTEAWLYLNGYL